MAKRKTKTHTRKHKRPLVTTSTRVEKQEFRVTIKRIEENFRIVATVVRLPGKGKGRPSPPLIRWSCPFNEKEADALVWSMALELGYEVDEGHAPLKDIPLYVLEARSGWLDIRLYLHPKGPEATIVVSRAGAQKILKALAKVLDWKLTG